jgi:HTH-type transcriptional regulator/antitoxin HipB
MQVHTVRDLGAAVREARSQQNLTQAELARRAGVSRDWLVRLEQGHPRLEVQLVLDVLSAAGLALTAVPQPPEAVDQAEATWDRLFPQLTDESDHG